MTEPQTVAVQLADVTRSVGKRKVFNRLNADFHVGQLTVIQVEKGPGRALLARLLAGLSEPDAGRIHRLGAPAPVVGAPGGFTIGGSAMRGLRLRAEVYNVEFDSYVEQLSGLLRSPEKLRGPVSNLEPFDRAVVTFASAFLLPCSHYIVDGQFLPVMGEAADALRPLMEETQSRAAMISIRSENENAFRIKPDRIGLIKHGVLAFRDPDAAPDPEPKPETETETETDLDMEPDPDNEDDEQERRDAFP